MISLSQRPEHPASWFVDWPQAYGQRGLRDWSAAPVSSVAQGVACWGNRRAALIRSLDIYFGTGPHVESEHKYKRVGETTDNNHGSHGSTKRALQTYAV